MNNALRQVGLIALISAMLAIPDRARAGDPSDYLLGCPATPNVKTAPSNAASDTSVSQLRFRLMQANADDDNTGHNGLPAYVDPYLSVGLQASTGLEPDDEGDSGTDYLQAIYYNLQQRAYPHDTVDASAYARALQHRAFMARARIGHAIVGNAIGSNGNWQFVGPTNLAVPDRMYFGTQIVNGRVNAVAYDPASPGTMYLGGATSGLWKSTNYGQTWQPLSDSWPYLDVSSITLDPTNHNTIYVGTGDYDGYGVYGRGIMESTDAGTTWTDLGVGQLDQYAVSSVVVDPGNPNLLTASTGRGSGYWGYLWTSTDGGVTWNTAAGTSTTPPYGLWSDVEIGQPDSNGHRYYYAACTTGPYESYSNELWRSSDQGATWQQMPYPSGMQTEVYAWVQVKIAPSKTNSQTVYLLNGYKPPTSGSGSTNDTIWKSTDAGNTWTNISGNLGWSSSASTGTINSSQNWDQCDYDSRISCTQATTNGVAHDVLFVQLVDIEESANADGNWLSVGGPTITNNALTHSDQHAMTFDPSQPARSLVGNDGGVYQFDSGSQLWTSLNGNLGLTQFYAAAYDPNSPNVILGGVQDNGSPFSSGDIGNWSNPRGGDGGYCAINPSNSAIQYISNDSFREIIQTTDGWNSVKNYIQPSDWLGDTIAFIPPMVLDPTNPNQLYAGTNYLWRYSASTGQWTSHLGSQQLATDYLLAIGVAPSNGSVIYTGSNTGELYMSTTQGSAWSEIDESGLTNGLPNLAITSISVNPSNAYDVIVGLSGTGSDHLWECANTNAASPVWTDISGTGSNYLPDIPLNTIARDPADPVNTLYVGTDIGVFSTTDGGTNWTEATASLGLPNVRVDNLTTVANTGYLNAATFGRGIWRVLLDLPSHVPTSPSNLSAAAGNNSDITLSWSASTGQTSYSVYRGTSPGAESSTPLATGITATTYHNTGLAQATTYYYTVKAINAAGASTASNEATTTTTGSPPKAPTNLTAQGQ